jgi:geranylgeranyl reductase family protein
VSNNLDYDVIVVGGGPVGCAIARDIAAKGYQTLILEEHQKIGEPVHCSGLISERTLKISRVSSKVVLNQLKGALVYGPGKNVLELKGEKVYALVIDRGTFDNAIAKQALRAGARILCNTRATKFNYLDKGVQVEVVSVKGGNCTFTSRLLIGADGHHSIIARGLNLPRGLEKILLFAAEVSLPDHNDSFAHIFLDRCLAPGWFGWLFPAGNNLARVGLGISPLVGESKGQAPHFLFEKLVARYPAVFQGMEVLQVTSGIVPIGILERTYDAHVLLAGDAAAHVKPISGGGLYLGLQAAECCAAAAIEALRAQNFTRDFLSAYQKMWEAAIGLEIRCGLRHRETFLTMKNDEMESLLGFLNKLAWQKLILKYGDLDYHSRLAARLAFIPFWASRFLTAGLRGLLGMITLI